MIEIEQFFITKTWLNSEKAKTETNCSVLALCNVATVKQLTIVAVLLV